MAIVIGPVGATAMKASEEFERHVAYEIGLRPVFKMKHDWYNAHRKYMHHDDGSVTIEHVEPEVEVEYPSNEEVDEYIRKREEYVADQILKHHSWEDFVKRCQTANIEDYIDQRCPCDALGGQCKMDCGHWNRCQGYVDIVF